MVKLSRDVGYDHDEELCDHVDEIKIYRDDVGRINGIDEWEDAPIGALFIGALFNRCLTDETMYKLKTKENGKFIEVFSKTLEVSIPPKRTFKLNQVIEIGRHLLHNNNQSLRIVINESLDYKSLRNQLSILISRLEDQGLINSPIIIQSGVSECSCRPEYIEDKEGLVQYARFVIEYR